MSRDVDEQLKLAHKVVHDADRPNRKISVILLRYNVNKAESSYAQIHLLSTKIEEEKIHQIVYVRYKFSEIDIFAWRYDFSKWWSY